ncbi:Double-stranded RNA-binding protein 2 [Tripterygium wilfordii]|uniref:Double-stranded RNA-binding protein 2 n=1 Tax=Tripterygium wilfordii TaxID=458696 RepID=A0A7J7C019_TRIWF|nr:double-stranded RNA-binding protein 2-like [Tripterygium wilfordii]KAF5727452.1 Double-stranded RNA-binding protein 2 [Tripterygium wilfordii]
MYKNQLQELAQRSCFNLPSYTSLREGPDHEPRFKATVNFNGEIFESPNYCSTLRQAEHSAAEVALNSLSNRGPSHSLAARILDETGVYKNLLQEIAQRVGAPLPQYTTFRSGLGHLPIFTGSVELAGITFTGEPAKSKKQAEKNAALAAWTSLKQLAKEAASSSSEVENNDELEQITITRALLNYRLKEKVAMANSSNGPITLSRKFPVQSPRPTSLQSPPALTSKILPLICPKTALRSRLSSTTANDRHVPSSPLPTQDVRGIRPQKFPAAGAAPYVPIRQIRTSCHGVAPPVTIRTVVPVFSAPPIPPPSAISHQAMRAAPVRVAPPVNIRHAVPAHAAPTSRKEDPQSILKDDPQKVIPHFLPAKVEETKLLGTPDVTAKAEEAPAANPTAIPIIPPAQVEETESPTGNNQRESVSATGDNRPESEGVTGNKQVESQTVQSLEQLKI